MNDYLTKIEGYNESIVEVEYEFDNLENVTEDEFCCLCIIDKGYDEDISVSVAGLTLEDTMKLRDGLNKLIDNYVLNKDKE